MNSIIAIEYSSLQCRKICCGHHTECFEKTEHISKLTASKK